MHTTSSIRQDKTENGRGSHISIKADAVNLVYRQVHISLRI